MSKSQRRQSPSRVISEQEVENTVLGQALGPHRLPTPSAVECARLIESVEADPELVRVLAALMQRACVDPDLWGSLRQVALEVTLRTAHDGANLSQ